jgi:hypothetical protein
MRLYDKIKDEYLIISDGSSEAGRTIVIEMSRYNEAISATYITAPPPVVAGDVSCGLVSIEASNAGGVTRYQWTFRAEPILSAVSSESSPAPQPVTELAGAMRTRPISMHKDFSKIYAKYGKTIRGGVVEWTDLDPDTVSGSALSSSAGAINPMKGIRTYSVGGAVFSDTKYYPSREGVPDIIKGIGRTSNPPGVDGDTGVWLLSGSRVTSMGSGYRVDTKWIHEDRGWLKELYPKAG